MCFVILVFGSDPVEGFNVFKTSKSSAQGIQQNDQEKSELSQAKKELNRQIEVVVIFIIIGSGHICFYFVWVRFKIFLISWVQRDALLRKKHNIHISGNNVPSPLENFSELSSRYLVLFFPQFLVLDHHAHVISFTLNCFTVICIVKYFV